MAPIRSETDRKSGRVLFRSGGVALRADRLLPVGRRLLVEAARLLVLGAVAPDQLHGADPLRDRSEERSCALPIWWRSVACGSPSSGRPTPAGRSGATPRPRRRSSGSASWRRSAPRQIGRAVVCSSDLVA